MVFLRGHLHPGVQLTFDPCLWAVSLFFSVSQQHPTPWKSIRMCIWQCLSSWSSFQWNSARSMLIIFKSNSYTYKNSISHHCWTVIPWMLEVFALSHVSVLSASVRTPLITFPHPSKVVLKTYTGEISTVIPPGGHMRLVHLIFTSLQICSNHSSVNQHFIIILHYRLLFYIIKNILMWIMFTLCLFILIICI